ncbi:TIGR03943 family protein [Paenibacillus pectinilyticus]|uniref:TIGR03943 family protein n=1 Tax=Paenibacillus pectinilyticus TaxID=512399 RepID=A0A1C1A0I3_9BACL|nr:TIGR03943 family protein [Paenibacillus pectinilyticus]OCT13898.1 TIGR03943 family protein [Paenibacillus pectinilyticus]
MRVTSFHYFLRTAILLGFSSYIVYLVRSDALQFYIAPRMMFYDKIASVILYVIAVFQGYVALRAYWGRPVACECEQPVTRSSMRNTVAYGLLILPLMIGFLLPDTALNSTMVAAKGINLSAGTSGFAKPKVTSAAELISTPSPTAISSDNPYNLPSQPKPATSDKTTPFAQPTAAPEALPVSQQDAEIAKLFQPSDAWNEDFAKIGVILYKKDRIVVDPEIYMEILSTIDLFKDNFIGKQIELTGFVYREEQMETNQFVVGRFAVSCCSADASPYGVLIDFPTAQNYPKDMWVKVTGTIQNGHYNGNDIFKIAATHIEKIAAPSSPYVYPNFEPLQVLK